MAQAECIITAIRELMSRGPLPTSTSTVRAAHSEFVAALAANPLDPIYLDVNSDVGRADHLEKVFAALHVYFAAIVADTAQNTPGGALDRCYLDNVFQDLTTYALSTIRNAAEEMRQHENWRAS
jgi:hypothetical protein